MNKKVRNNIIAIMLSMVYYGLKFAQLFAPNNSIISEYIGSAQSVDIGRTIFADKREKGTLGYAASTAMKISYIMVGVIPWVIDFKINGWRFS